MHRLLKRQLKKISYNEKDLSGEQFRLLLSLVDQAYQESDEDRNMLENALTVSSREMQGLYDELQRSAKRELQKSETKYQTLVENLRQHYFFYTHNTEGVFTYISSSITDILGYSQKEFLTHYKKYLTDDPINDQVAEFARQCLSGEQPLPHVLSIYHKDGSVRYLEVTELPVFDNNGRVESVEGIARDVTAQYEAQEKLSHLAQHDALTGIPNRLNLYNQMEHIIAHSKSHSKQFAMIFLDLDHFKNINDTLGHDIGDKLLKSVVNRVSPVIREEDIFARIGGDEFIIVLTDTEEINLTATMGKIMNLFREEWLIDSYELKISASIGISLFPQDGDNTTKLMKNADIAMYKAKELGRDNFSFFTDEINREVHEEMQLEQDMFYALEHNEFALYYQPKVESETSTLIGAEALIRWHHPTKGLIPPEKFITLAENTGFILKLGDWIIREGCRAIARFNSVGAKRMQISINVSPRQLQHGNLYRNIKEALIEANIDASQLCIEITESVKMDAIDKTISLLTKIKRLGVSICMDDFGTGYSSLSYLHRFPIDSLKIDKAFVDFIPRNDEKTILLDTIIIMARTLGLKVIAEGVEEEFQREYLIKKGCLYYQGALFSGPVEEYEFIEFIGTDSGSKKLYL